MNLTSSAWSVQGSCDSALPWIVEELSRRGLRALQTFDLHDARLGEANCPCPQHGLDECDCQMVVLLVYGEPAEPATLVLHGNDAKTWLTLVHTAAQQADPALRDSIETALQLNLPQEGL